MRVVSNFLNAFEQLRSNRLRSSLTVLAMVIGVMSTIVVVSVVQGFTGYVTDFLSGLGTNAMWIVPERPAGEAGELLGRVELDEFDMRAMEEQCTAIRRLSPLVPSQTAKIRLGREEISVPLEGVAPTYHAIRNFEVGVGRPFAALDVDEAHDVCLLGRETLKKLGADEQLLGDYVWIDSRRFRVIGILNEKGSFLGESQDNLVLVPWRTALRMYPQFERNLIVTAQAIDAASVPEAKSQIANLLRRRHGLEPWQPNDFRILTQDEILQAFESMSLIATVILAGIVGISLLVGGIGIMNVMLVSVTERTREIGLRKAVGARRRDILLQFLVEAMTLSLIGGTIGVALGYGISWVASLHPRMVDIVVPTWAVVVGFGISAGTGVVFGLLPAVKAALLNPIDALRHE